MAPDRDTAGRLLRDLIAAFLAITFLFSVEPCFAVPSQRQVTVEIFSAYRPLSEVFFEGHIQGPGISDSAGTFSVKMENRRLVVYRVEGASKSRLGSSSNISCDAGSGTTSVWLPPGSGSKAPGGHQRTYRGRIKISPASPTALSIRNTVDFQDYVNSVVGSESLPGAPLEALKAQSVLVQTLMARKHERDMIKDTTEIQAYLGVSHERPEVLSAVAQTLGKTLLWNKQPINVYFHSCCAGATSSSRFFGTSCSLPAYDRAVKCTYCKPSMFWKETVTRISKPTFDHFFPQGVPAVTAKDESGRPLSVSFPNHQYMSGYDFWLKAGQRFGWHKMPGTRFSLSPIAGGIEFKSTGGGHGVGLCQWGAQGMAKAGKRYDQILKFYFPGTTLSN